jgi:hypothetical protein
VYVAINKSGNDRAAFEVDLDRLRSGERANFLRCSYGGDAVTANGDRICNLKVIVDGQDFAVVKNTVGRLGECKRRYQQHK